MASRLVASPVDDLKFTRFLVTFYCAFVSQLSALAGLISRCIASFNLSKQLIVCGTRYDSLCAFFWWL